MRAEILSYSRSQASLPVSRWMVLVLGRMTLRIERCMAPGYDGKRSFVVKFRRALGERTYSDLHEPGSPPKITVRCGRYIDHWGFEERASNSATMTAVTGEDSLSEGDK